MTVFTKLHIFDESVEQETGKRVNKHPKVLALRRSPCFVIQNDAIEMLKRADVGASIKALHEAKLFRLPYPEMVIEFSLDYSAVAYGGEVVPMQEVVYLREIDEHTMRAEYAFIMLNSKVCGFLDAGFNLSSSGDGIRVVCDSTITETEKYAVNSVSLAVQIALLLLNMRGIERDVHEFSKLNKAREKRKRPAIRQYSYIRIGHVYRSDGTSEKYTSGHHKAMHMRSGYTRTQHFGKGREESKLVYIPPCIVNYVEGGVINHKTRIVKS